MDKKERTSLVKYIINTFDFNCYENNTRFVGKKVDEMCAYPAEVIKRTFIEQKNTIAWCCQNKEFNSTKYMISYSFGIVRNNIDNVLRKYLKEIEREKKRAAESENEYYDEYVAYHPNKYTKDISCFLKENEF